MKFSFDSAGYRSDLAANVRKQEGSAAKELLTKERTTLEYSVAANIEKMIHELSSKKDGKRKDKEAEHRPDSDDEKPIVTEEIVEVVDANGEKQKLKLQTIELSMYIPDEVKLLYDIRRLLLIEHELGNLD